MSSTPNNSDESPASPIIAINLIHPPANTFPIYTSGYYASGGRSGHPMDRKTFCELVEPKAKDHLSFMRAKRRRIAVQEKLELSRLQEIRALGKANRPISPQAALDIARAVHAVFTAERKLARIEVKEYRESLAKAQKTREALRERVYQADLQVRRVQTELFEKRGVPVLPSENLVVDLDDGNSTESTCCEDDLETEEDTDGEDVDSETGGETTED